jgi:hypothetical protein
MLWCSFIGIDLSPYVTVPHEFVNKAGALSFQAFIYAPYRSAVAQQHFFDFFQLIYSEAWEQTRERDPLVIFFIHVSHLHAFVDLQKGRRSCSLGRVRGSCCEENGDLTQPELGHSDETTARFESLRRTTGMTVNPQEYS